MKSKRPKYISQKQFKVFKKEILSTVRDIQNTRPIIIDPDPYFFDKMKFEFYQKMSQLEMKFYKQKFPSDYDEPTL